MPKNHRHLSNIDGLKARTACLVCFISTVNGDRKKERKRSLERLALVAGTWQILSNLFWTFNIYAKNCVDKSPVEEKLT
jgi:hypothetical protein